jgi:hypothetical protein
LSSATLTNKLSATKHIRTKIIVESLKIISCKFCSWNQQIFTLFSIKNHKTVQCYNMTPYLFHMQPCSINCLPWKYKDSAIIFVLIKTISLIFDVLLSTAIETEFEQKIKNNHTHRFLNSKYVLWFFIFNNRAGFEARQISQLKLANYYHIFLKIIKQSYSVIWLQFFLIRFLVWQTVCCEVIRTLPSFLSL